LQRLPRHSHYKASLDDDEEYASIALSLQQPDSDKGRVHTVPLAGYSDVVARLDNVFDAITALHENLVDYLARRKSSRVNKTRAPRPETAQQRLRRTEKTQKLDALVQRMTGGR
jgi:hypothetical protein